MSDEFLRQLDVLPSNLASHLMITVIPLALSLAISLPTAILLVRRPSLRYPVMTAVSVVQTIPGLALLALMVPILAGLGGLSAQWLGVPISALGFAPTVIALTLYGLLPILRNTVTGILGVDPAMTEAARGMGMTDGQVLRKVELPLAAPVILAGVRTAAVWVVGTATLATPVGQRSLGNYIFSGLQTRNWIAVLFGCVAAAALAIVLDTLVGALERSAAQRRRGLGIAAGSALVAIFACGLVAPQLVALARGASSPMLAGADDRAPSDRAAARGPLRIGSKTFTEQYILAELIARRLAAAGFAVERTESLGSTIGFDALTTGDIDVFVDYTGTLWANSMGRGQAAEDWKVLAEVNGWLAAEKGVRSLGTLGFENAYALAMRRDQAEALGIRSIADLATHAGELKIGGDYEFFNRPEWRAIRSTYSLRFRDQATFDPAFLYESVARGDVDVISAFTTDGRLDAYDLIVLEDPRGAIPPYDALLMLSPAAADRPGVAEALRPLVGAIDAETMRGANDLVDRNDDRRTIEEAAAFLESRLPRP